jgi:hypothetical protein
MVEHKATPGCGKSVFHYPVSPDAAAGAILGTPGETTAVPSPASLNSHTSIHRVNSESFLRRAG